MPWHKRKRAAEPCLPPVDYSAPGMSRTLPGILGFEVDVRLLPLQGRGNASAFLTTHYCGVIARSALFQVSGYPLTGMAADFSDSHVDAQGGVMRTGHTGNARYGISFVLSGLRMQTGCRACANGNVWNRVHINFHMATKRERSLNQARCHGKQNSGGKVAVTRVFSGWRLPLQVS